MSIPAGTGAYKLPRRNSAGEIDAGSQKIKNLTAGAATGDAVEYDQLQSAISGVSVPSVETINAITTSATATAGIFTTNTVSTSGGAVTVTLPAAATGKVVKIVVIDDTNAVTIAAGSGDALGTNVPTSLLVEDETLKLIALDATTWRVGA
jgi:hypothetical protein